MIRIFPLAALAALVVVSATTNASARKKTWVASNGNNAADCSRATPCASFLVAYANTDPGGEIGCVDGGDFGELQIYRSITVNCDSPQGSTFGASTATVLISTA